ncbi:MAG: hypothetical protein ACREOW_09550 [Thermodesulfobacteriota bacterium]
MEVGGTRLFYTTGVTAIFRTKMENLNALENTQIYLKEATRKAAEVTMWRITDYMHSARNEMAVGTSQVLVLKIVRMIFGTIMVSLNVNEKVWLHRNIATTIL